MMKTAHATAMIDSPTAKSAPAASFPRALPVGDGSTSKTCSHRSSSWPTVARVRGLRLSSTWHSRRVRTLSAWSPALGPGGTTSLRHIRRYEIGSIPA
jgi:hypothetical protein